MIAAHLPALQIVVPLLSAPLCVLLGKGRLAYGLAVIVCWTAFAISILLLGQVLEGGVISYRLGGWAPPWGIELRVDAVNAYVLLIVTAISALVISYAKPSVDCLALLLRVMPSISSCSLRSPHYRPTS